MLSKLEVLPLMNGRLTEMAATVALQQQQQQQQQQQLTRLEQQQQHKDEQQLQLHHLQRMQHNQLSALAWQMATIMDARHEAEVEGCLVVFQPRHIKQPLTCERVADELGWRVEVLEQPPHRKGAVIAKLGVPAARGTLASLRSAAGQGPPATPGGLLVRQEKTKLGSKRQACLRVIRSAVQKRLEAEGGAWAAYTL